MDKNSSPREWRKWSLGLTVAQKCHRHFNLLTAISTCSRQLQFAHSNFNLLTAISTCSRQFQFAHSNFNFLTANNAHGIFPRFVHHLSTSAAKSGHQKSKRKIKSRYLKSIFKVKHEHLCQETVSRLAKSNKKTQENKVNTSDSAIKCLHVSVEWINGGCDWLSKHRICLGMQAFRYQRRGLP